MRETSTMSDSLVTTEFDADTGIATMTFNRPAALNAISVPMAEAFLAEAQALKDRSGLRCIVLTGSGRAFMAGGDIASMTGSPEGQACETDFTKEQPIHQATSPSGLSFLRKLSMSLLPK